LLLQVLEVVRLAHEAGDVSGQRGGHRLALVDPFGGPHQLAVFPEVPQPERAQPLGQPRVDERGLALRQVDAGGGVDDLGDRLEVAGGQQKFALDDAGACRLLVGAGTSRHAASASVSGSTRSRAMRLTIRPSRANSPFTKVFTWSQATSGVGCTMSSV